jgi:Holliday junction resolvase RusA-like endonuclease
MGIAYANTTKADVQEVIVIILNDLTFTVPGQPIGKGRPRVRIIKKKKPIPVMYSPPKTVKYEALVRACFLEKYGKRFEPISVPFRAYITAEFEIPKSYTKKKTSDCENGYILPAKKPDADNIAKIILDACNKVVFVDDALCTCLYVRKTYASDWPGVTVSFSWEDDE